MGAGCVGAPWDLRGQGWEMPPMCPCPWLLLSLSPYLSHTAATGPSPCPAAGTRCHRRDWGPN